MRTSFAEMNTLSIRTKLDISRQTNQACQNLDLHYLKEISLLRFEATQLGWQTISQPPRQAQQ